MGKARVDDAFSNFDLSGDAPEARRPSVRFAFDDPDLRSTFAPLDAAAGRARTASRILGYWAIGLVLVALLVASADPLLTDMADPLKEALGYLAALLGLAGTAVAIAGRGRKSPRSKWLQGRLQTESLRLFHFQYIASRLPDIVAASDDPALQAAYCADRARAFAELKRRVIQDPAAAYDALLKEPDHAALQDLISQAPTEGLEMSPAAADAFAAWRRLRLEWQLGYCDAKLADAAPKGHPTPRRQERIFEAIGWTCIAVIVGSHVLHFTEMFTHIPGRLLQVLVVWTALIALGARALESGLAPQREVERYEQYRANIRVAKDRFDAADSVALKVETMRAFERVTLEEMIIFIRTHARSHFLL